MKERHIRALVIFVGLSGLLLNYQNCGSQSGTASNAVAKVITDAGDGRVDTIDPNTTGGLSFVEKSTVLTNTDADLKASGFCSAEQDGAILSWKVLDESQAVVAHGQAVCEAGFFQVVVADASSVACGAELDLKAALGSKASAQLHITKHCQ